MNFVERTGLQVFWVKSTFACRYQSTSQDVTSDWSEPMAAVECPLTMFNMPTYQETLDIRRVCGPLANPVASFYARYAHEDMS